MLSLLLRCLRVGENKLPSTPFKIYTEFNKKCACTIETSRASSLQREVGSALQRTIFELFLLQFCYETHRLIQKRWEGAKKFLRRRPVQ